MKAPELFSEYIWLVNTINNSKQGISLAEINEKWKRTEMSGGLPYSRATFNRHKSAIQDIFGLLIECDNKNGHRYYISNKDVLREDSLQQWMINSISVGNMLSESIALQDRILLENTPSASDNFKLIIDAMRNSRLIDITYCRYQHSTAKSYTVAPYCIKLFRRRWYLLSRFADGGYAVLSIDRIKELSISEQAFIIDPTFDATSFFDNCFGVNTSTEYPVTRIVLRAYGWERYAMHDLPLHNSQRQINKSDDYIDYELYLRPTSDFVAHILSRSSWLKVLEPLSLAEKIKEEHLQAARIYDDIEQGIS
ncbi:MAG: WYL domain-containing protein [Bacteroidales bacterium]|nr:WYL domain-containing protein [Bacteroidales bacterium]